MSAWGELDRFTTVLRTALESYGRGASALEIGRGQHRAFLLQFPDRMVLYARPVFRERPRRVIELRDDASISLPRRRRKDRLLTMKDGVKVIASGDRIYFCRPDGQQVAGVFLPWIGLAERKELTRRFQSLVGEPPKGPTDDSEFAASGLPTLQ